MVTDGRAQSAKPAAPSVGLVQAEVVRRIEALERVGANIDGKAGLVVGFALVLVGLGGNAHRPAELATQAVATVAAMVAAAAFWPRRDFAVLLTPVGRGLEPRLATRHVLDAHVIMYENGRRRIARQLALVQTSVGLLASAVGVTLAFAVSDLLKGAKP